jgi:hypothetical protein
MVDVESQAGASSDCGLRRQNKDFGRDGTIAFPKAKSRRQDVRIWSGR